MTPSKTPLIYRLLASVAGLLGGVSSAIGQLAPWSHQQRHRAGKLGAGWMHQRLMRHFAEKNQERQRATGRRWRLLDEHGAYTEVGGRHPITGARRKWLAGVSAQRGY